MNCPACKKPLKKDRSGDPAYEYSKCTKFGFAAQTQSLADEKIARILGDRHLRRLMTTALEGEKATTTLRSLGPVGREDLIRLAESEVPSPFDAARNPVMAPMSASDLLTFKRLMETTTKWSAAYCMS